MIFLRLKNYHFLQRLEGLLLAAIVANIFVSKLQILIRLLTPHWVCQLALLHFVVCPLTYGLACIFTLSAHFPSI